MTKSKAITLTLAILGAVLPFASSIFTGPDSAIHLTPAWALLVSSAVAALYSVDRGLTKIAAGSDIKSLFASTETWLQIAVVLTSIVTSAAGVVPLAEAGPLMAAAAFMVRITKLLQALPDGLFAWPGAKKTTTTTTTETTSAPKVLTMRAPDPDSTNTPVKPMAVPTTTDDAITKDIMPPKGVVIVPPKKPPTDPTY